jgi:hypothetical protein
MEDTVVLKPHDDEYVVPTKVYESSSPPPPPRQFMSQPPFQNPNQTVGTGSVCRLFSVGSKWRRGEQIIYEFFFLFSWKNRLGSGVGLS